MNDQKLKLIPLGGMGNVSQNMFVYEYENEILLVDCGLGFPDMYMPGVDIIIPDVTYLQEAASNGKEIIGMILSHGHDDHIGALPYILPQLPSFPIFASALTAGFATNRIKDGAIDRRVNTLPDREPLKLGEHFTVRLFAMTHSVPDTKHMIITTPIGNVYHGSDFKLDHTPVDGVLPDYDFIKQVSAEEGIHLFLTDCLGVERQEWGESESTVGPEIKKLMMQTEGKFIVTLMSSHLHRIQQVVDVAAELGRKVAFVGRSVEQNVRVGLELDKIQIPQGVMIDKGKTSNYADNEIVIVIAGSQGQEGSSLMRAISGTHQEIQITEKDMVVFSADAIPGNEVNYYGAVDELCLNGVDTVYPSINRGIHHSGHANAPEQLHLLEIVKPKFILPIGGANRHRVKYKEFVAAKIGFDVRNVLIPREAEVLGLDGNSIKAIDVINLKPQYVDGLGIGDVGPSVLNDRQVLSQAGMIIVILKRHKGKFDLKDIHVVSRGFVFMKDATEVINYIKRRTAEIVGEEKSGQARKNFEIEKLIERKLGRSLYKIIEREPMIEVEIIDFN